MTDPLIVPKPLKKLDTIGILSTARSFTEEEVAPAARLFEAAGFRVKLGETAGKVHGQFAGTDEERLADFQQMLDDPEVKAIVCARGGYGTARIVDGIDFSRLRQQPKWVCGYSDVTVLHNHLQGQVGVASLHSTMPLHQFKENQDEESFRSLLRALRGEPLHYEWPLHPLNRNGSFRGPLTGGNLSILYNLTGTPSEVDWAGKVLLIEDVDEYLYHIDRMMVTLKRAGKLANLAGLLVGGMTDMNDNATPFGKSAEEIIFEHVGEYSYPVLFGFPSGHGWQNRAVVMGVEAKVEVRDGVAVFGEG